ncbi:MAG: 2-oxoacid:ferredoxin oxidoreductase subunit beta, partial [Candidatus Hodarchaeota archaeon]
VKLVAGAGATYVARWTAYHVRELSKSMIEAAQNKGFSFIEVLSQCPTQFGRRNDTSNAFEMLMALKYSTTKNPEIYPDKIPIGIFVKKRETEFIEAIQQMKAQNLEN